MPIDSVACKLLSLYCKCFTNLLLQTASQFRCGIILAAGEGRRLPFVENPHGNPLPKQYVSFIGKRVKISGVLDSVLQTQVAKLAESIEHKSWAEFQKSYDETLNACNGCHAAAGYKFIHIVRPIAPPVPNQSWEGATHSK